MKILRTFKGFILNFFLEVRYMYEYQMVEKPLLILVNVLRHIIKMFI